MQKGILNIIHFPLKLSSLPTSGLSHSTGRSNHSDDGMVVVKLPPNQYSTKENWFETPTIVKPRNFVPK